MWRLLGIFFLAEKMNQIDEIHEAATRPRIDPQDDGIRISRDEMQTFLSHRADLAEWRKQQPRLEAAKKLRPFMDGKPLRIFHRNPVSTFLYWIYGRKFFAETYLNGRTRGYVVYEGLDLDAKLLTPHEFERQFSRWAE